MPISQITGASIQDGSIVVADLGITTFNTGTGNNLTLQANSATGIVIDVTGNTAIANTLTFSSTGARIRGDFSNATESNRVLVQTSTTDGTTNFGLVPNGAGTGAVYRAYNNSTPLNSARAVFGFVGGTSELGIRSEITGSGTYLPMTFLTGGAERLRIDTSGNMMLGVTTVSSSTKFDVYGNSSAAHIGARVTNAATDGYSTLWLSSSNDGLVRGGSTAAAFTSELAMLTSGSIPLTFYTANTKRMTIGATGNIGIGTTSPSQLLHVAAGTILASNTTSTTATVSIAGNGSTTGTSDFALQQGTSSEAYVFNRANSFLVIGTNNTERMRITSAGIIGIGTNGPAGDFRMTLVGDDTINPGLVALNNQTATQVSATLYASSSFGWTGTRSNHSMLFITNGSERMRLDTSGNLGIGTSTTNAGRLSVVNSSGSCGVSIDGQSATGTGAFLRFRKGGVDTGFIGQVSAITGSGTSSDQLYWTETTLNHRFYTEGTEKMRITSGGNVGIGTTSPDNNAGYIALSISGSTGGQIYWRSTNSSVSAYAGADSTGGYIATLSNHDLIFRTNNNEKMRIIPDGALLIGSTVNVTYNERFKLQNQAGNQCLMNWVDVGTGSFGAIKMRNNNGEIGSISYYSNSVGYNTTSDYRLKQNIMPMIGALAKVAQLKPCTYNWKTDGSNGQGFIAHELAEVIPDAVSGEKDAVNEDGSIKPQSVDTSFLVATLTAAIQEQQAIIESLKSRIEILEQIKI